MCAAHSKRDTEKNNNHYLCSYWLLLLYSHSKLKLLSLVSTCNVGAHRRPNIIHFLFLFTLSKLSISTAEYHIMKRTRIIQIEWNTFHTMENNQRAHAVDVYWMKRIAINLRFAKSNLSSAHVKNFVNYLLLNELNENEQWFMGIAFT